MYSTVFYRLEYFYVCIIIAWLKGGETNNTLNDRSEIEQLVPYDFFKLQSSKKEIYSRREVVIAIQCDQMAWLFVQYLATYNNDNLHSNKHKIVSNSNRKVFNKNCQNGKISPNLVPLFNNSILKSNLSQTESNPKRWTKK